MNPSLKNLNRFVFASSLLLCLQAKAQFDEPIGRGREIRYIASSCRMGKIPQTSKAAEYNEICHVLTDAEKCLALIKRYMDGAYHLRPATGDRDADRTQYCLHLFRQSLLGN